MLESLGAKKYVLPLGVIIGIFCVFSLMMYPLLHAEPKDVPMAILSLDQGVSTPAGDVNLGDQMVAQMVRTGQADDQTPILWTQVDSQVTLDVVLNNNDIYGAIIIPADFTQKQMAAAQANQPQQNLPTPTPTPTPEPTTPDPGTTPSVDPSTGATIDPSADPTTGTPSPSPTPTPTPTPEPTPDPETQGTPPEVEKPTIKVVINQGKNPMVAQMMETAVTGFLAQAGFATEVSFLNDTNIGSGFGAMMSGNVIVMPIFMMTAISSILLAFIFRTKKETGVPLRLGIYTGQLIYGAVLACLIAGAAVSILIISGGMTVPVVPLTIFLAIASFCVMTLFLGALNLAKPFGILVILTCFACGMAVGMLAREMLPAFWQSWIYPWVPQRAIGQGAASIMYMGADPWNSSTVRLVVTGAIGLVLMVFAAMVGNRKKTATLDSTPSPATPLAKIDEDD
ncbi:MAG: hypothetical protein FWG08_06805 [Propionibacteriaceae bacterium]|nr:hypothetical protein [Propionibacteriaceae bacterium]